MTFEPWFMSGIATGAMALLASLVTWADSTGSRRGNERIIRLMTLVGAGALTGSVSLAVLVRIADVPEPLLGPIVGLGILSTALIMPTTAKVGLRWATRATFAVLTSGLVAIPVAVALFASDGLLHLLFRTLDLAGALAALQTAAVAGGIALIGRRREPWAATVHPSWRTLTSITLLGWALWIGWLIGMELAIDEVTPRIVVAAIIAPLISAAAWMLVQRLRHGRTTRGGAITGLLTGLAAITSACGYVDTVGAVVVGAVAGALGSLLARNQSAHSTPVAHMLPLALSIGSGTGVVALGIFSTRTGLAYTGQPELLFSQVASLVVVAAYAAVVSAALWCLVVRFSLRRASTS